MTDKGKNSSPDSPWQMDILQTVLDAIPCPIFLIDSQAQVELINSCAHGQRNLFGAYTYRERLGNLLGCINALSCSDGCGGAENCRDCPIRKVVADALDGKKVFRKKSLFQLLADEEYHPIHLWLTASSLHYGECDFVVLILEDITELMFDTGLIPVCTSCGKAGNGEGYHESIGTYIQERFDADFKHGLCADCAAKNPQ